MSQITLESLTTEESDVIQSIVRYGLTTDVVVQRLLTTKQVSTSPNEANTYGPASGTVRNGEVSEVVKAAATDTIATLLSARLITEEWLYSGCRCYVLSNRGHELLSVSSAKQANHRCSLSTETKIRRYAMLSFCCLGEVSRIRLTQSELSVFCSETMNQVGAGNYYVEPDANHRLGFIRVDMGGRGRWDRVLAKAEQDARRILQEPACQTLIRAGQMELTIATATQEKAERMSRQLMASPCQLPIRIAVISELLDLIAPPPD